MIDLAELLAGLTDSPVTNANVEALTNDSRQIKEGGVFLAAQGVNSHGLDYLNEKDIERLAYVCWQPPYKKEQQVNLPKDKSVEAPQLSEKLSEIAGRYFNKPSTHLPIIGVTGTNGKTSVTNFMAQLTGMAVMGTLGYGRLGQLTDFGLTTPDAFKLQLLLNELSKDCSGVAMEVSSHALSQHRVEAVSFASAVFTNLSQDHLDFHGSMDDYFYAKKQLFLTLNKGVAIVNVDCSYGERLANELVTLNKPLIVYGSGEAVKRYPEYLLIKDKKLSPFGISATWTLQLEDKVTEISVHSALLGGFNIENLAAAALASLPYIELTDLADKINAISGVRGRLDKIELPNERFAVVDYAHTPDALAKSLQSLRQHFRHNIVCLFGCGGDRDKTKRPQMAMAANQFADAVIVTDDNPRTEGSAAIIADIMAADIDGSKFTTIANRSQAIEFAINSLQAGDVLLVAGKGHEEYQIIGNTKHPFSDYAEIERFVHVA